MSCRLIFSVARYNLPLKTLNDGALPLIEKIYDLELAFKIVLHNKNKEIVSDYTEPFFGDMCRGSGCTENSI